MMFPNYPVVITFLWRFNFTNKLETSETAKMCSVINIFTYSNNY